MRPWTPERQARLKAECAARSPRTLALVERLGAWDAAADLADAIARIEALERKLTQAEWDAEMGCENPPERCECPGCWLARDRAFRDETGPA